MDRQISKQEQEIKRLEDRLSWYEEKFSEMQNSYYSEGEFRKKVRYFNYQYKVQGRRLLFKKLLNPKRLYMFFRDYLVRRS